MGSRYIITGVQIGMISAYLDLNQLDKARNLIQLILDEQSVEEMMK